MNLSQHFHAYVLALKGWEHRLERFQARAAELGVTGIKVIYGVDGTKIHKPNWWRPNARKWACALAHMNAQYAGIMAGLEDKKPILIFEDDAHLRSDFVEGIGYVIGYFRDHPDATMCYVGGRIHRPDTGEMVSHRVLRGVMVGGGYGYALSHDYAVAHSGRCMDDLGPKVRFRSFAQDTRFMHRWHVDQHATVTPVIVGHHGGPSVILQKNRKGEFLD